MKNFILSILLSLCMVPAMAQTSLQVHGLSKHTHAGNWNEVNTGLGIRQQISEDFSAQAGFYKNSEFGDTVYVVGEYMPVHSGTMHLGVFAGVATGYKRNDSGIPVAGLAVKVDTGFGNVAFKFVPKVPQSASGVFSVEIGFNF